MCSTLVTIVCSFLFCVPGLASSIHAHRRHALRSRRDNPHRSDGDGRSSFRKPDNIFSLRDSDKQGDSSQQQHHHDHSGNAAFHPRNDSATASSRQLETETVYLDVQPSIRACECDGTSCTEGEKHVVGDPISICLWSNFLDITAVVDMALHVDDFTYKPVVDGIINKLTEVSFNGKKAVVTTMIVSDLVKVVNPSTVKVDATVSFGRPENGDRRYLKDNTKG